MRTLDRPSVEMVCPGSNAVARLVLRIELADGAKTYPVMRSGARCVPGLLRFRLPEAQIER